jgi:hypothetical protein
MAMSASAADFHHNDRQQEEHEKPKERHPDYQVPAHGHTAADASADVIHERGKAAPLSSSHQTYTSSST